MTRRLIVLVAGLTVRIGYPRDAVAQYLEYGSMYDASLTARTAAR